MTDYKPSSVSSFPAVDAQLQKVATALDKKLSTLPSGKNFMETDLDMNSNRILNLGPPEKPTDPVRLQDLDIQSASAFMHTTLLGRNFPDQHEIGAISGLREELDALKGNIVYLDDYQDLVFEDDWTDAILAAIQDLRENPQTLLQYIGGPSITAYSSGTLMLGRGVYRIRPGGLLITQDHGLTIKGQGSRRTNKSMKAATTLLVTGSSTPTNYFGLKFFGNGARGAHLADLDINYESSGFTGDLIHALQVPGFTTERVRLGWHNTEMSSANSLLRTGYDEFNSHKDIVFDGAVTPWLSDTTTEINGPTDFGGSNHILINPVFYDATSCYMKHASNRTRIGLTIINPAFDVIGVNPQRAVDLANVDGFSWIGGGCGSSGAIVPSIEWVKLDNVTGIIQSPYFGDLTNAGTFINSVLEVKGCRLYCNNGFVFDGGNYEVSANEVSKATNGFRVTSDKATNVRFGINYFGPQVTYSYVIPAADANNIVINYDKNRDVSVSKWSIPPDCNRVKILNESRPRVTFATGTLSPSIYDTGTEYISVGSSSQAITLPTPQQGCEFTITHIAPYQLTINGQFLTGSHAAAMSQCTMTTSTHVGQSLKLVAYSNVAWRVENTQGAFTFT